MASLAVKTDPLMEVTEADEYTPPPAPFVALLPVKTASFSVMSLEPNT